jgi:hypothetical protein
VRKWAAKEAWQRMKPTPIGRGGVVSGVAVGVDDGKRRARAVVSSAARAGSCGEEGVKLNPPGIIPGVCWVSVGVGVGV